MLCEHCLTRPQVNAGATCGDSYCQEAAYCRGMARNVRGKRRQEFLRRAARCEELAQYRDRAEVRQ